MRRRPLRLLPWGRTAGTTGPGHLYAQLNLTAEQKAQIKTIMTRRRSADEEHSSANACQLAEAASKRSRMTRTTRNVVAEVSQANASLHSQMITMHEDVRAQVFKILTPAQQTQLAALQAQMQSRGHGAWGPRGAGAPPAAQ